MLPRLLCVCCVHEKIDARVSKTRRHLPFVYPNECVCVVMCDKIIQHRTSISIHNVKYTSVFRRTRQAITDFSILFALMTVQIIEPRKKR